MVRIRLLKRQSGVVGLVAVVSVVLFGTGAWSQIPDLPDWVKQSAGGVPVPGGGQTRNATVSNAEYRTFRQDFKFPDGQDLYPAVMTEREAADFVAAKGKKLDVDYVWRRIPKSDRGILYVQFGDIPVTGTPDQTPGSQSEPGMVYVPEGVFIMGSDVGDPDEGPKQQEKTGAFFIDKLEVSNADFKQAFAEFQFEAGREDFPAIVTWEQASEYAAKVGKRLPTEAEWEKAARGTDGRTFPWGESYDPSFVNWDQSYPRGAAPARPESPYGCIDMAGGAWEWTADWYKPYAGNTTASDSYGEKYKVIRGGGCFNDVAMMRTTARYYLPPNTTGNMYVGFRCVKDAK